MSHNLYTINNQGADVASFHGANLGVVYIGRGESSAYTASMANGDYFEFYDTDPVNTLGATLTQGASAGWIKSVGLSAGTYEIHTSALVTGTTNDPIGFGSVFLEATDGTNYFYELNMACRDPEAQNGWNFVPPQIGHSILNFGSSITLRWVFSSLRRTPSDIGSRMSECSFLFIRKLA